MGCIYKWTNQVNQMGYIGKCHGDVMTRYRRHINGHGNQPLKEAIDEYGIENFTFEILHDGILDAFLDDYEKEAIKKYNTVAPNGYNLTHGGNGAIPSEEHKEKISRALQGKPRPKDVREKISRAQRGKPRKPHSQETRDKMSRSRRGRVVPQETRDKIRSSLKSSDRFKEAHRKRGLSQRGKKLSQETCEKIGASRRGTKLSQEHKEKISRALQGRTHTEEARAKMSEVKQSPERKEAYKLYLTFPTNMDLNEKRRLLREAFPEKNRNVVNRWVKEWEPESSNVKYKHSKETRGKMACAARGRTHTKESRQKISIAKQGKSWGSHTKETRNKLSSLNQS